MNFSTDFIACAPVIVLAVTGMLMVAADLFGVRKGRHVWTSLACAAAWIVSFPQTKLSETAFSGTLAVDPYTWILNSVVLAGLAATFLLGGGTLKAQRAESSVDVDFLLICSACGAMIMLAAVNLMLLFVGFELMSIPLYVLAGIARKERASAEGALKYFILGAFSSTFLLYGLVLIYGATGTMQIAEIAAAGLSASPLLLLGIGLIVFGFGFKVSLVPFHVWTPDVYQGAPTSITTFMAVVVKVAGFGTFLRLMMVAFGSSIEQWSGLIWILAVLTMTVGNLVALRQQSIKRMLAYSSVAHAGYLLIGFLSPIGEGGPESVIFYLIAYSLMTIAAFGVVLVVTAGTESQYGADDIRSLSRLGWTHPFLALVMTIAMLSLAGFPPLAGFFGKFYLFTAAVRSGYIGLTIIAVINSVISLFYYLRVVQVMYFSEERELGWEVSPLCSPSANFLLAAVSLATITFSLFANSILQAFGTSMAL